LVPAVPTLEPDAPYWQYTSVPPEGVAWWQALPLALTGEWHVKGGIHRWISYKDGNEYVMATTPDNLIRICPSCEMMLVFIPSPAHEGNIAQR